MTDATEPSKKLSTDADVIGQRRSQPVEINSGNAMLHGDVLETIFIQLPTIDLVSTSSVSTAWNHSVNSSLALSPRRLPFLFIHQLKFPNSVSTHFFDPHSRSWHLLPFHRANNIPRNSKVCTDSATLFNLTPSFLTFSSDPFHLSWNNTLSPPLLWRSDPVVGFVGSDLVVAGGVYDFEDDPFGVEVLRVNGDGIWRRCQSMPSEFNCSLFLTTTVVDDKLWVAEKNSGLFSVFNPITGNWGHLENLTGEHRSTTDFFLFAISYGCDSSGKNTYAVVLGVGGRSKDVSEIRLWKLNYPSMKRKDIGTMPPEMTSKLVTNQDGSPVSSIEILTSSTTGVEEFFYVYNASNPQEIFMCRVNGVNRCEWESTPNPLMENRSAKDRLIFTCFSIDYDELRSVVNRR
ncbi:hypothetical protein ZOSMA_97G00290 [Zostera marina]|uniref:F-box domain-containing protein n=1 Tax=Zostera marina TaxID=29655 RepID=A0A0K9NJK6_ZOSMR|nr:hypothetical protein ZOSMA_97G00290 [Zostera marina]